MTDKTNVSGGTHTSHVGEQLGGLERKATIYDIVRERFDLWMQLLEACDIEGKRQVLATLYINDGVCQYKQLYNTVPRSKRVIKKHVGHLDEMGIVNRSGNPAVISFTDTDVALLVSDALAHTDKV
jgi:hypothetical protein